MIKIRRYQNSDYSFVIKNLKEADMFRSDFDSKKILSQKISSAKDSILVAVEDTKVVGSVYLIEDPFHCFIFRLVVNKNYRKRGIGSMLLQEAEMVLKKKGFTNLLLLVNKKETKRLTPFYEKHGYEKSSSKHQLFFKKLN